MLIGKLCWQPTTVALTLCNSSHNLRKEDVHTRHLLTFFCRKVHGITPLWPEGGEWGPGCNVHLHFITPGNELRCTNKATQPSHLYKKKLQNAISAHLWVDYVNCASRNLGKQNIFHGSSTSSLVFSFGVKSAWEGDASGNAQCNFWANLNQHLQWYLLVVLIARASDVILLFIHFSFQLPKKIMDPNHKHTESKHKSIFSFVFGGHPPASIFLRAGFLFRV